MAKTIVALYDNVDHAQRAVRDLVDTGVDRENVSLMANTGTSEMGDVGQDVGTTHGIGETSGAAEGAGVGAGIGAAMGGVGGLLVGLGALTIPGIGPVLAAGPLAAALGGIAGAGAGAIAGGATGGLIGALTDMGVNEEQAGYYAEGIRRGGTLLTVRTDDTLAPRAVDIMNRHNPVDVRQRATQWRETGWSSFDPSGHSYTGSDVGSMSRERDLDRDRDIHRSDFGPSGTMGEGSSMRSDTSIASDIERDSLDRPEDRVNYPTNVGAGSNIGAQPGSRTFDTYENDFRTHFNNNFADKGYSYNQYTTAYHYGYDLAENDRFMGREWHEAEPELRRDWESRYPDNAWEDFKDAVQHAWMRVRDVFS